MNAIAQKRLVWFGVIMVVISCWLSARASVTNSTSGGALHATIQAAVNAAASGDTLLVSTGRYLENIVIHQKSLTLLGGYWTDFITRTNLASLTYVNGGAANTVLTAMSNCLVTLEYMMLTNGAAFGGGGIVLMEGVTLTARYCDIAHNVAWTGGGLSVGSNCTAVLIETPVYRNRALGGGGVYAVTRTAAVVLQGAATDVRYNSATFGGGVYADGARVQVLNNADVYGNVAVERGGGMYLGNGAQGRVSGSGSTVGTTTPNMATNAMADGGGVYVADAALVVENSAAFWANHATQRGGAIFVSNGSVVVRNHADIGYDAGTVSNYAGWLGGGIFGMNASVTVSNNARIMYGHAAYGGGVFLWNSSGVFDRAVLHDNVALDDGGGMYAYFTSAVTMTSCLVATNRASIGGGMICAVRPVAVVISNSAFVRNSATVSGALHMEGCADAWVGGGSRIAGNSAISVGAAYFSMCTAPRMQDVLVLSNTAVQHAGVLFSTSPAFDVADCDFIGNAATSSTYGALAAVGCRGRLRTAARPALMAENHAAGGGAIALGAASALEVSAAVFPLLLCSNSAAGVGGAVWLADASTATVMGAVQLVRNRARYGGAIMATNRAVITLLPTNDVAPLVCGNTAVVDGGGLCLMWSSVVVAVNCTLRENVAVGWGGGLYSGRSHVRIASMGAAAAGLPRVVLQGNQAVNGGAVYSSTAAFELFDALVVSNAAANNGGGVRVANGGAAALVNCVLVANNADSGGGIANGIASLLQLRHCTVSGNQTDGVYSSGGPMAATNCIFWGNVGTQMSPGYTVNYSDISGGYLGAGNLDADPQFADPAALDYALTYGSPCVDTGIPAGVTWDCIGAPRPMGITYDMGAYELDPAPVLFVAPTVLDFGAVVLGDTSNLAVGVENIGNSMLTGAVQFVPAPIFSVTPGSYSIPPFATTNVVVTFAPPLEYQWTQTVVFASNGGAQDVVLIGTGIPEPGAWGVLGLVTIYNLQCTIWRRRREE